MAVLLALVVGMVAAVTAAPASAATETGDTLGIVKETVAPSNAEIAVRLSEGTPLEDTSTVVVARDDEFADALASGVLQKDFSMLLVPSTGQIPARVLGELDRLAPDRVIILGGDQAVGIDVEQQLSQRGHAVERRAGDTRLTTATVIAGTEVPDATTAILARAFPSPDSGDETQAFADTLGVGAWAADEGWPVMLTNTEFLSDATREYLLASDIEMIKIVGGTAAINQPVEEELVSLGFQVERIAGTDRFGTAIEVAKERGAVSAADVAQVVIVDSQFANAWAGGLAGAAHSSFFGAPILLTSGPILPDSTADFLASGTAGGVDQPVTCIAFPTACEQARVRIGLPAAATVDSTVPDGAAVAPGQEVTVTIDTGGRAISDVEATGDCLTGPVARGSDNPVTVRLADPLPPVSCQLRIGFTVSDGFSQAAGLRQTEVLTFTTFLPAADGGLAVVPSGGVLDARQVASNLVGGDVQVFNARLTGAPEAAGLFAGGQDVLGFDQGIVLSTGFVAEVVGPNQLPDTSGTMGTPGDPDLTALAGQPTFDAVVLQFDFVAEPTASEVRFEYVFGSEEYLEFVGSAFNDVFAFFINGVNCAMVQGAPVSVNTVNPETNSDVFRDNGIGPDGTAPLNIELDGLTVTLPCQAAINQGGTNSVKLAIADATDEFLDSAVFIRAASFQVS